MLPDGSVVPMTPTLRKAVLSQVEAMAEKALRCLALAHTVGGLAACARHFSTSLHSVVWVTPAKHGSRTYFGRGGALRQIYIYMYIDCIQLAVEPMQLADFCKSARMSWF